MCVSTVVQNTLVDSNVEVDLGETFFSDLFFCVELSWVEYCRTLLCYFNNTGFEDAIINLMAWI